MTTLSAEEALARLARPETVLVDVRESEELAKTGRIAGAVHVPRGVLEFQADPASPTHKAELGGGRSLILYCASGNRSALAAKALQEMGLGPVAHVAGGFAALEKAAGWSSRPDRRRSPARVLPPGGTRNGVPVFGERDRHRTGPCWIHSCRLRVAPPHTALPTRLPMPAVTAMARAPQKATRAVAFGTAAPPARAPRAPRTARKTSEAPDTV